MRIIGNMVKNNCCCEKNNRQNVQEYKNRIIGQKKRIIYQDLVATLTPISLFQASIQVVKAVTGLRRACLESDLTCISPLCFLLGIVNLSNDTYTPRAILEENLCASGGQHGTVSLSSLALV